MIMPVRIGPYEVGPDRPCFITAEIGINHNGSLETALKLIDAAKRAGCQAVKFQKRTVDAVYTPEELAKPRESPFGSTNGDLKRGLEFSREDYVAIDMHCAKRDILWYVSCWDEDSVDFIQEFSPPCWKIASAGLTDAGLLRYHHDASDKPIILSTGMSTPAEIDQAFDTLDREDLVLLHCTSTYPAQTEELNLRCIPRLQQRYMVPVGYSGHEVGLPTTVAAVAQGACMVERHITLSRAMWGSDQSASVEPRGFAKLVRDIRAVEAALGDGIKRVYESELPIKQKLRRKDRLCQWLS